MVAYTPSCIGVCIVLSPPRCRYQRGRFYRGWGFGIGIFSTVSLIILLSVVLSIRYQDNKEDDNYFAPGDTRIISYSSSFCERLTLSGDADATLYLLEKKPSLSGPTNRLKATPPHVIPADTYKYLYYHIHPRSEANFTYCINDGNVLSINIIKGSDSFNDWKDDGDSSHTKTHFTISNLCSDRNESKHWDTSYFASEDTYYFAFDNLDNSRAVTWQATLQLNRTEYLPQSAGIKDSCRISGDSCWVSIPLHSDYVAMVEVANDTAASDDNISISWSCDPRVWLYLIVVLVPLIFVVSVMVFVCVACVYYARHRSQKYSALSTAEVTQPDDTTTVTTTTTPTAPPPYNPGYGATQNP